MIGEKKYWLVDSKLKKVWVTRKINKDYWNYRSHWSLISNPKDRILSAIAIAKLTDQTGWISYDT